MSTLRGRCGRDGHAIFLLVNTWILVNVSRTMKRILSLVALLGFLSVFVGCDQDAGNKTDSSTNAAPAAPSTNK
jgi:hypothetical protein